MIANQELSLKLTYRTGNVIVCVMNRVCSAWTELMRGIGTYFLSAKFLPYLWFNDKVGCLEHLHLNDVFAPLSQRTTFIPSVRLIRSTAGADQNATSRVEKTDRAMCHLDLAFLFKLKQIICNNTELTIKTDEEVASFPPILALVRAHGTALLFVFS